MSSLWERTTALVERRLSRRQRRIEGQGGVVRSLVGSLIEIPIRNPNISGLTAVLLHCSSVHFIFIEVLCCSMALCRQKLSSMASQCVNFWRQMSTVSEKRNIEDHKRRLLAAKYEVKRKLYKALHRDVDLPNELREKFLCKLAQLPRNSSFTRVRNRCIFTGRPRAVYEKFRMSRIVFRSLASQGMLMGIKKASW
ncbi:hypothetical protein Dsin_015708 [Dipteronia sinensis]|uniref:Small ribosomal subunit protein uS14m n=1 Tax=Dipteronia sinensis TaxID=43782 RepID=A0AAE0ACY2_9ROSI|nr:hypothetical protein Dsin_015708 [Dipteronia sinensis]